MEFHSTGTGTELQVSSGCSGWVRSAPASVLTTLGPWVFTAWQQKMIKKLHSWLITSFICVVCVQACARMYLLLKCRCLQQPESIGSLGTAVTCSCVQYIMGAGHKLRSSRSAAVLLTPKSSLKSVHAVLRHRRGKRRKESQGC